MPYLSLPSIKMTFLSPATPRPLPASLAIVVSANGASGTKLTAWVAVTPTPKTCTETSYDPANVVEKVAL